MTDQSLLDEARLRDAMREYTDPIQPADDAWRRIRIRVESGVTSEPRRPVWQLVAAVAVIGVVLAGGVWFATRSSEKSAEPAVTTASDEIKVGAATVLIPEGMKLEQFQYIDDFEDGTSPVTSSDGQVVPQPKIQNVRARLSSEHGMCTISSSPGHLGVERFNAVLMHFARVRTNLEQRINELNEQIAALPPGSDDAPSLADRRTAALQQIDQVNQLARTWAEAGPQGNPADLDFAPTDAGNTSWQAQATAREVVRITCPDRATARTLVDATTLAG